jgi:hypothetical protein
MGWIGCSHSKKLRSDFVARTFALISPVQLVLHWVYFRNKTIPNAPKHCETHQNISLWSNGADWMCSFREFLKRPRGTNYCINCTSSAILHRVSSCNKMIPNAPEHYETLQNMSLGSYGVDRVQSFREIMKRLRGTNFCINFTSSARFALSLLL